MSRDVILPIFLPNRGCPGRCIFCDQRTQSGTETAPTVAEAAEVLRPRLRALKEEGRAAALAFYGGSFDGLPARQRQAWLGLAADLAARGLIPGGIRVSAHPAGLTKERVDELTAAGVTLVEVGVQSLDDQVLGLAGRGHSAAEALEACVRLHQAGIQVVVQLMAGLPGAAPESDRRTAGRVGELAPQGVRIHPTLVLRGTGLEDLLAQGTWRPPDLEDAVLLVADMVQILEEHNVTVMRLGIQEVDGLRDRVMAGAWHPAFGELVKGEVAARRLAEEIQPGQAQVKVPPRQLSWLLGHGARGQRRLAELLGHEIEIVR